MNDKKKQPVSIRRGEMAFLTAIVIGLIIGSLIKQVRVGLLLGLIIGLGIIFTNSLRIKR